MAYVVVEDATGSMELLCFSKVLETCGSYLRENLPVLIRGKLSVRDEKAPQILCDHASPLTTDMVQTYEPRYRSAPQESSQAEKVQGNKLFLKFPSATSREYRHMQLVLQMFYGKTPAVLVMADTRKQFGFNCQLHPALLEEARRVLGTENVVIQ